MDTSGQGWTPAAVGGVKRDGVVGSLKMQPLKAIVKNGRLVLDEPTDLPEGEVVELRRVGGQKDATATPTHRLPEGAFTPEELAMMDGVDPVDAQAAVAWMRDEGPDPWPGRSS